MLSEIKQIEDTTLDLGLAERGIQNPPDQRRPEGKVKLRVPCKVPGPLRLLVSRTDWKSRD